MQHLARFVKNFDDVGVKGVVPFVWARGLDRGIFLITAKLRGGILELSLVNPSDPS